MPFRGYGPCSAAGAAAAAMASPPRLSAAPKSGRPSSFWGGKLRVPRAAAAHRTAVAPCAALSRGRRAARRDGHPGSLGAAEAERPSAHGRMANDLAQPHAAICAQQAFAKMRLHTKRFIWHGWGTQHVEQVAVHTLHWCC